MTSSTLFADLPRAAATRFAGQSHRLALDPALSRRIRAFARERRINLSTVFLALSFLPVTGMLLSKLHVNPMGGAAGIASNERAQKLAQ